MPKFNRQTEILISELRGLPAPPRRGYHRPVQELDSLIGDLVKRFRIGESSVEEKIATRWHEIVGDFDARRCAPQRISNGGRTLLVFAATAVLCQELQFEKRRILQRIQKIPGCDEIRDLVIRTG